MRLLIAAIAMKFVTAGVAGVPENALSLHWDRKIGGSHSAVVATVNHIGPPRNLHIYANRSVECRDVEQDLF